MATKRSKFPEIRCWIICGNFNERTRRLLTTIKRANSQSIPPQYKTWNQTSRRLYRYFFYQITEIKPKSGQVQPLSDDWNLRFQALVRELRRRNGDYRRQWQRRIFQILELWHKVRIAPPAKRIPAWQTCAQILTSANRWKRRQPLLQLTKPAWTNVLWRAAHLNKRKPTKMYDLSWQVTYRILAANRFRERMHGWGDVVSRSLQILNSVW